MHLKSKGYLLSCKWSFCISVIIHTHCAALHYLVPFWLWRLQSAFQFAKIIKPSSFLSLDMSIYFSPCCYNASHSTFCCKGIFEFIGFDLVALGLLVLQA